ncbi:MAG: MTH938/NDUFAF3 family protein [Maricaulaceae bacterium]|jgi:uncharacterized protein
MPNPPRLTAYGEGGFRFADGRREGSVLIIDEKVEAWPPARLSEVEPAHFDPVFAAETPFEFVLFGVGDKLAQPPEEVRERFARATLGLEIMDTGAACRVYASLLAEGRRFAAALIAVD